MPLFTAPRPNPYNLIMDRLSQRHRLFVDAYAGDLVEAMQLAGYQGQPAQLEKAGKDLLKNPQIQEAIKERSKYLAKTKTVIANREERQALWTDIMRNRDPHRVIEYNEHGIAKPPENIPLSVRLKASEQLAKSEGDFIDRLEVSGNVTVSEIIHNSLRLDISEEELDAIEADYEQLHSSQTKEAEEIKEEETETESDTDVPEGSDDSNGSTDGVDRFI